MPLGISPSVRPIRLCSTTPLTCSERNVLSPTLLVQHRSWQKVFLSFCSTMNKILRTIPPAGIRTPFSPEYNGKTACVNNNLDFVRKAEQRRKVKQDYPANCTWEPQVALTLPRFEVIIQVL